VKPLRLRPLRSDDEDAVVAAHRAMELTDRFPFALGYRVGMSWSAYLQRLEANRCGSDLPTGWVPATFLVAEVGGEIVGRSSTREGGHIGYGVLAEHRGRGYASEILRQSLIVARAAGVDRVLVTCGDDNVASARVIERCGGLLESIATTAKGGKFRRYWID
jgi:predicted acetyltransferase